ncbi:MAG: hypothetical protein HY941_06100 [Gammaproteobacteria bacterium]|nr:hypothetical protein [Gammaproteobacteria bacterium]
MNGQQMDTAATPAAQVKRARLTLVLIFALFALPLAVAWLLNFVGDFTPGATVNHGALVQPVRPVSAEGLLDAQGAAVDIAYFRGEWTLLFRQTGECGDACHQTLYVLRQVRLAQGKNIDRVRRMLLLDGVAMPAWTGDVAQHYPGLTIARAATPKAAAVFPPAGRLYLVDPLGNLMMEYALDADPRGIIKDLERLLRISYVG